MGSLFHRHSRSGPISPTSAIGGLSAKSAGAVPPRTLGVQAAFPYASLLTVTDAVDKSREHGRAGLFDSAWGDTRQPHTPRYQREAAGIGHGLVAVDYGRRRQAAQADARRLAAQHAATVARARLATCALQDSLARQSEIRGLAHEAELPEPDTAPARRGWRRRRALLEVGVAAVLAVPDVFLTAPAFDGLGLDDTPLIWGQPWSDERHIAALGVVLALLLISHLLGLRLPVAGWRGGRRLRHSAGPSTGRITAVPTLRRIP